MKYMKFWKRMVLIVLCILVVFTFVSCAANIEVVDNTQMSKLFLDKVIKDDFEGAYALVKDTVNTADFTDYWNGMRLVTKGSTTYTLKQIGWKVNVTNGLTTRVAAYQVYLNNGKIAFFRVITRNDIEGIAGVHFSDITDFLRHTDSFVPVVKIVLLVVSLLVFAFVIWMFVDCLRRKMKYKVLWAILIFGGVAFTVTIGKQAGFHFMVGLLFQRSTIAVDPSILGIVTKIAVPVGAILYLCLRKRLTIVPVEVVDAAQIMDTSEDNQIAESNEDSITDAPTQQEEMDQL